MPKKFTPSLSPIKEDKTYYDAIRKMFVAHRGMGANETQQDKPVHERFPESTLISFIKAMEKGAECLEFDVFLSSDGHLMVIHDDDLSVNAKKVDTGGTSYSIGENTHFVHAYTKDKLQCNFDVSNDMMPEDYPIRQADQYSMIPTLQQLLLVVSEANRLRKENGQPSVKLNIELKGQFTGGAVAGEISHYNNMVDEDDKISKKDIYFLSFYQEELSAVVFGKKAYMDYNPKDIIRPSYPSKVYVNANLVLAITTEDQYKEVGQEFDIINPSLNEYFAEGVKAYDELLRSHPKRHRGLSAIDVYLWDIGDKTVAHFCGELGLPIHIAVPCGKRDLNDMYIRPALENILKVAQHQSQFLPEGVERLMFIKTDHMEELAKIIKEDHFYVEGARHAPILLGGDIPLYYKLNTRDAIEETSRAFDVEEDELVQLNRCNMSDVEHDRFFAMPLGVFGSPLSGHVTDDMDNLVTMGNEVAQEIVRPGCMPFRNIRNNGLHSSHSDRIRSEGGQEIGML